MTAGWSKAEAVALERRSLLLKEAHTRPQRAFASRSPAPQRALDPRDAAIIRAVTDAVLDTVARRLAPLEERIAKRERRR